MDVPTSQAVLGKWGPRHVYVKQRIMRWKDNDDGGDDGEDEGNGGQDSGEHCYQDGVEVE